MLKNVKSIYFIQKLFSFIDEYSKLKLVKYNKSIQKNINIDIINYIYFKGKYIIYESNEKGKEYNYEDNLIFEGGYLNGERNGKGKEYNRSGELIFEGEYLNGKRNGKGKEYYRYGYIIFEGEYLNNKRNGKGKEYNLKGKLIFEGEYLNGKELKGTKYEYDNKQYKIDNTRRIGNIENGKLEFEDEYSKAKINEKIKYCDLHGNIIFEGEYLNDKKWNGKGYDENGNIIYELKNGNGKVKEYDDNGNLLFEGEYINGKTYGKGKKKIGLIVNYYLKVNI